MLDYLARFISKLKGSEAERAQPIEGESIDLRRAPRARVRVPVKTLILGTEIKMSGTNYSQSLSGYTRDLSKIGVATILPGAQLNDLDLTGKYRRLKIVLELSPEMVEIFATTVYYRQRLYVDKEDTGWLI